MDDAIIPEPAQEQKKTTILLVEDDPILSKMYTEKFTMDGFTVIPAFDGEEGLAKATKENYDILILDIMMPKVSGTELLVSLRKSAKGQSVPVIVITNLSDPDEQKKLEDLRVYSFFTKAEITPGQLSEAVKKALKLN